MSYKLPKICSYLQAELTQIYEFVTFGELYIVSLNVLVRLLDLLVVMLSLGNTQLQIIIKVVNPEELHDFQQYMQFYTLLVVCIL